MNQGGGLPKTSSVKTLRSQDRAMIQSLDKERDQADVVVKRRPISFKNKQDTSRGNNQKINSEGMVVAAYGFDDL